MFEIRKRHLKGVKSDAFKPGVSHKLIELILIKEEKSLHLSSKPSEGVRILALGALADIYSCNLIAFSLSVSK